MIISIRLFIPNRNLSTEVVSFIQQIVVTKLVEIKSSEPDQIGPDDFLRVKIITHPLLLIQDGQVVKDTQNRIEIKRNGTNLFRKTLPTFKKEAEKFKTELLKEISIHIGNNLEIIY